MKATTEHEVKQVKTKSLKTEEPFKSLFSVDTETYKQTYSNVYVNMDLLGFDKTQPIIVWKGRNVVIDGHTRLKAALEKEIKEVWVIEKEFLNEDDAIQYAIHLQRDRRNLTDADIFHLVCRVDQKHPPGRPRKTTSTDAVFTKTVKNNDENNVNNILTMAGIHYKGQRKGGSDPDTAPHPKTVFNIAVRNRIPIVNHYKGEFGADVEGSNGQKSTLFFDGNLTEGLTKFCEWAYGRSSDITATLIGTSRSKVEKCRNIINCKNEELREDLIDKILRGKITINRASSSLKHNGKPKNGAVQKGLKVILFHKKK